MLIIEHSQFPRPEELREIRATINSVDCTYPPPYIMDACRVQMAVDEGGSIALVENALLIKWVDDLDGRGMMYRLLYSEEENNYLIDLAYPALI